ncbi:unnamed protein product [Phytophthora lilii]|uniref:Unnamed protein product n=1 Tax=Phytophthora lilii TaxID=2077276 RepID=A0A9W6TVN3_9STRA|nr:unnamed protein product [Phytophthora lilii]
MRFHQKRFFAYPSGAPSLHTLMSLLGYGDAGYSLHKLEVDALHAGKAAVVASASIERPGAHQSRVAVAYAVGDNLFLQILTPHHESLGSGEAVGAAGCGKFELEAAPTCMFSVQARGSNGDVFYGVMVCCTDSMMAFGFVENEKENKSADTSVVACARLNNEQFAAFFPELATFSNPVLAVDTFTTPEKDQGWIAFGCADGYCLGLQFCGGFGCLGGPFKSKDLQLNGPVTSLALFPKRRVCTGEASSSWQCNLVVTCAIGQAVVYQDLFGTSESDETGEVLFDSDTFDSIFAGVVADIDLVKPEILLGTDSQVMLAYEEKSADDCTNGDDSQRDAVFEESAKVLLESSVDSPASSHNIWNETEPIPVTDAVVHPVQTRRRKWQRLSRSRWDLETFGAIYSLLWRDVNHDGVPELLIASSTGIYVYEADPLSVIQKLERVLATLSASTEGEAGAAPPSAT